MAEMERFSRLRPKSRLEAVGLQDACLRAAVSYRAARGGSFHPSSAAKQKTPSNGRGFVWRRWRDSNSRRAFDPYTISNRARSTNYATSPRVCSRKSYQLVSLPIIMQPSDKVKQYFCAARSGVSSPVRTKKLPLFTDSFSRAADTNGENSAKERHK